MLFCSTIKIIDLLIGEMEGRGWPGLHSEKADPMRILKSLRTAARSTIARKRDPFFRIWAPGSPDSADGASVMV